MLVTTEHNILERRTIHGDITSLLVLGCDFAGAGLRLVRTRPEHVQVATVAELALVAVVAEMGLAVAVAEMALVTAVAELALVVAVAALALVA